MLSKVIKFLTLSPFPHSPQQAPHTLYTMLDEGVVSLLAECPVELSGVGLPQQYFSDGASGRPSYASVALQAKEVHSVKERLAEVECTERSGRYLDMARSALGDTVGSHDAWERALLFIILAFDDSASFHPTPNTTVSISANTSLGRLFGSIVDIALSFDVDAKTAVGFGTADVLRVEEMERRVPYFVSSALCEARRRGLLRRIRARLAEGSPECPVKTQLVSYAEGSRMELLCSTKVFEFQIADTVVDVTKEVDFLTAQLSETPQTAQTCELLFSNATTALDVLKLFSAVSCTPTAQHSDTTLLLMHNNAVYLAAVSRIVSDALNLFISHQTLPPAALAKHNALIRGFVLMKALFCKQATSALHSVVEPTKKTVHQNIFDYEYKKKPEAVVATTPFGFTSKLGAGFVRRIGKVGDVALTQVLGKKKTVTWQEVDAILKDLIEFLKNLHESWSALLQPTVYQTCFGSIVNFALSELVSFVLLQRDISTEMCASFVMHFAYFNVIKVWVEEAAVHQTDLLPNFAKFDQVHSILEAERMKAIMSLFEQNQISLVTPMELVGLIEALYEISDLRGENISIILQESGQISEDSEEGERGGREEEKEEPANVTGWGDDNDDAMSSDSLESPPQHNAHPPPPTTGSDSEDYM